MHVSFLEHFQMLILFTKIFKGIIHSQVEQIKLMPKGSLKVRKICRTFIYMFLRQEDGLRESSLVTKELFNEEFGATGGA